MVPFNFKFLSIFPCRQYTFGDRESLVYDVDIFTDTFPSTAGIDGIVPRIPIFQFARSLDARTIAGWSVPFRKFFDFRRPGSPIGETTRETASAVDNRIRN